jgi:hypothetical protein
MCFDSVQYKTGKQILINGTAGGNSTCCVVDLAFGNKIHKSQNYLHLPFGLYICLDVYALSRFINTLVKRGNG